jgi:hypothetical protein
VQTNSAYTPDDFADVCAFASRSLIERLPLDSEWHPGLVVWELATHARMGLWDVTRDIRLWRDGEGVAALAWFYGPNELRMELSRRVDEAAGVRAITEWAEAHVRAESPRLGAGPLEIWVLEKDTARIAALEACGYAGAERAGVAFRFDLTRDIPTPPLPPGMRIRDCVDGDIAERAACHRDAWSNLDHIGIKGARSSFREEVYREVRAWPVYDPSLDLVAETADGTYAACCICWADPVSGIGTFEPVGTRAGFRGQGLSRAVNMEGMRRLKARGMRYARVGTSAINHPATKTYLSCGFELIDHWRNYVKAL